jgi:hypothetical protein
MEPFLFYYCLQKNCILIWFIMNIWLKFIFLIISCIMIAACTPVATKIESSTKITQKKNRTPKEIQSEISSHQDEIKRIHRQMVIDGLTVPYGFIIFQFEIMPDGSVGEIKLIRNNFGDLFAEKMTAIIKEWKFNAVENEETQLIELPYAFTAKE